MFALHFVRRVFAVLILTVVLAVASAMLCVTVCSYLLFAPRMHRRRSLRWINHYLRVLRVLQAADGRRRSQRMIARRVRELKAEGYAVSVSDRDVVGLRVVRGDAA